MTRTGHNPILVALLLLAFVSQSIAASMMACRHNASSKGAASNNSAMVEMHHDMAGMMAMGSMPGMGEMGEIKSMDHSPHSDHTTPSTKTKTADCCTSFGHCSAGGCALALSSETAILFTPLHSSISDLYHSLLPTTVITSLFRPPIFR